MSVAMGCPKMLAIDSGPEGVRVSVASSRLVFLSHANEKGEGNMCYLPPLHSFNLD